MKKFGLHEVRKEFLDFFEEKNHLVLDSFSLVPKNDKSLLLINAGMAPLKPYFTGENVPPRKRVATCQKCVRTGDIENVGKTDRHATFFEMLGNFSFGDYFKEEAVEWAWEFITERLEIPKDKIWVTIYTDDDEAFKIWNEKIGIEAEKIVRLGKEDNFWELEVGPCGPCSEIYVDRGQEYGCGEPTCKPGCDCDRYVEVWNLVFSQYDKDEFGNYNPLPNPNIDTGMGLERITAVLEGARNIFEVGVVNSLLKEVEKVCGKKYGEDPKVDESIRVITDHIRAMTFMVSDGILPSNEGRGYVLRRLIRRAARHGKLLGIEDIFLYNLSSKVIDIWKDQYNEIEKNEEQIKKVIKSEEEKFRETIDQGIHILEEYVEEMKANNKTVLDGDKAFKLYDTYGFPLDLTREILEEIGFKVDEAEFNMEMEAQRQRARKAREDVGAGAWGKDEISERFKGYDTVFKGYEHTRLNSNIIELFKDNNKVSSLNEGEEGMVLLRETPFYGESGGQVGDTGTIENDNFKAYVLDTKKTKEDVIFHLVKVESGEIREGEEIFAAVDEKRRKDIARNHSATHLLHRALKDVLGEHVNQAGSLVLPDRLRFDFTHFEAIRNEDLNRIEKIVNEKILEELEVNVVETSLKEAQEFGAMALFDEKYKDIVRMVKMDDYSKELCGGTHVTNTCSIGLFKIVSESGIASGVRRIEAVTGRGAYEYLMELEENTSSILSILKTSKKDIKEKVRKLTEELKEKEKEIESLKSKMASSVAEDVVKQKHMVEDINVVTYRAEGMDMNSLRNLGDEVKSHLNSGVVVLSSVIDDKISFVAMVTKDLVDRGLHAGNIIREVAKTTGGGGGGRPDMAQAGGKDSNKIDEALKLVDSLIKGQLKK
ncbi:alanine--tRNA ligase [Sporanaerobacter acetigenes]|uniref:Alanine--tRNA ligase n=1 Tax=Sporanaerobacter acetigenes DSM 13106 TaxID=1123281 RepID=A0A1M5UD91_9FIRM|nr:alanine--tRNA ligase [Sporanaerobacter acetigenes]SHH60910.1 alanyl-tRNA synthetase [Sporanaerobacter acetigenes DSM 13106]